MYGHFNLILKSFIVARFGDVSWDLIANRCDCDRDFKDKEYYNDGTTQELIDTSIQVLSLDRDQFLLLLGEHYLESLQARYDELLRNLGGNMLAFLQNLDYVHTFIMAEYPNINMPSFRCEADSQTDNMVVHYYSHRPGMYPLVEGILRAIARVYFKSDLQVAILSRSVEEVGEKGAVRHHVIFSIRVTKMKARADSVPTLIAQTKKGNERQILKTDIDRVLVRLREIRETQGEAALPLNKGKIARAKWRSLAKMSILYSGFVPQYPMTLTFNAKVFCDTFPYHIVFNQDMGVVHAGVKVQELMPGLRAMKANLTDFFELLHPYSVAFTFENVTKFINTPFVLKTLPKKMEKTWGGKPMVKFRGQMVAVDKAEHIIYLCSPYVRSLQDLEERQMKLADIPVHDVTRDMLWVELMVRMRQNYSESQGTLRRSNSVAVGISGLVTPADDDLNSNDPAVLRRLVLTARRDLAEERRQKDEVRRAFLPPAYLRGVQEGQTDLAGQFKSATVLFSDVVSFAQILRSCSPIEVVHLLTDLHRKFNRVCKVHQTFRVESIGDAYMVVSGAPDEIDSHPERIANTALGMVIAARDVPSPFDYGDSGEESTPIKIRIGICTGQVTCGVVGDVTPRCLVFGPAVNLASRLESHGMAGRVHTNQETRDILAKRGFRIEKRGVIEMRGQGRVKTFFIEANTTRSEDEIMGRRRSSRGRTANGVEVSFISDSRLDHATPHSTNGSNSPLLSSNKVSPTNAIELSVRSTPRTDLDSLAMMPYPDGL